MGGRGGVRPLLPGSPGCLVLATSRDRLGGLVARDGARRLILDVLTPGEAVELLARILGEERVTAERQAARELAEVCGLLPLALRIAAANLAGQPGQPIAGYVARLRQGIGLSSWLWMAIRRLRSASPSTTRMPPWTPTPNACSGCWDWCRAQRSLLGGLRHLRACRWGRQPGSWSGWSGRT
jgi:hypothetical protein